MLDWITYIVLAFAGAAAGFIDAIAGGGGLISVPALLWAGLPVPVALGTNKLQSSCGTTLAVIHYTRNGLIPWRELRGAVVITFVAAVLGVRAVTQMDRALLEKLVPILLVVVAVYTAANPRLGAIHRKPVIGRMAFALIFGSALGFYDGFFGPGTGSFWMLACVLALGLNLREQSRGAFGVRIRRAPAMGCGPGDDCRPARRCANRKRPRRPQWRENHPSHLHRDRAGACPPPRVESVRAVVGRAS